MFELVISGPEGSPKRFELKNGPVSLGRSAENQLAYPEDPWLSRSHLAFESQGESWFVKDCMSRNGTVVNSATLREPHLLKGGDRIYAGHLLIEVADSRIPCKIVSFVNQEAGTPIRGATIVTSLDKVLGKTGQKGRHPAETSLNTSRVVQALIRAGQELAGHRPLAELFSVILQLALTAMEAKRGVILTLEDENLVVSASKGDGFEISTAVRDRVIREKCSLVIIDAQADEAFRNQQSIVTHRVRSMMAVPLQTGDRVIGLIYLDNGAVIRPFQQEDVDLLTVMANVAAIRIEHARLIEVERKEQLMDMELSQAREIQQSLLPAREPSLEGYVIAGSNLACRTVGGDYYDYARYQDGRLALVIGDVAGKGLPAALMMSSLQARVQMLVETQPDPAAALTILNRSLAERSITGRFITFFYALLEPSSGLLRYGNAGHNYPIVVRADGAVEQLKGTDMVLGILPAVRYQSQEITMHPGDLLALYSDGVTEARNVQGQEFGEEGLAKFLSSHRAKSVKETMNDLYSRVRAWCDSQSFTDDFTIVLIKRLTT